MTTIKTNDTPNNRVIIQNFKESSLTIIGDYSSSTLTTYWVKNKFNNERIYSVHITYESAIKRRDFLNKCEETNSFYIEKRTIFV